ncbi:hypothetical protein ElyMa_006575400 [Elysia marginata]|uniref:Uncharacterized protein n=1 Tax=Elysia marginata TaxID=1093978 RepID=A0AAV4IBS3_9GAST|nr:hypothetical protein ElyMa_006575400 [Elysia marginata]
MTRETGRDFLGFSDTIWCENFRVMLYCGATLSMYGAPRGHEPQRQTVACLDARDAKVVPCLPGMRRCVAVIAPAEPQGYPLTQLLSSNNWRLPVMSLAVAAGSFTLPGTDPRLGCSMLGRFSDSVGN